jgi:hypothetical protein
MMPFSAVQCVFIVEHYFQTQSYEAVKQAYQVHCPDAAVPNKSTVFRLENQQRHCLQSFKEYVETGRVLSTPVWGDTFNVC